MSIKFMVETKDRIEALENEVLALKKVVHDFINEQLAQETLPPARKRDTLSLKDFNAASPLMAPKDMVNGKV